jgi:NAD(P)-dependent dehydrogenase (short-subunit alcohol dehydrogenase family)
MMAEISKRIDLHGQTAIVTGGGRGIGACIARTLAREGANVVVGDVIPTDETVRRIRESGGNAIGVACDITEPGQIDAMIRSALEQYGKIDILVANAGVIRISPFPDIPVEQLRKHLEVNVIGTFLTVQAVYKEMLKQKSGKIICIGSYAAEGCGFSTQIDYAMSKGAVHSLIKSLAKQAAPHGIYINGVAPGTINSDMIAGISVDPETIPLRRLGEPEDIAEGVLYLASPMSNFVTGQILHVNGGVYLGS